MRKDLLKIGLGVAASAAILWKGFTNSQKLELRQETVAIPGLPPRFAGFRLLFLTDLHLQRHSRRADLLLARVEEIDPDLVCLGGDYANSEHAVADVEQFFTRLATRVAVVGIYGNTDYRLPAKTRKRWTRYFSFLLNSALCLDRHGEQLWIAGVDDPHHKRDCLPQAMTCVPSGTPTILLAHSPEVIERPLDPRVRLILCGHTHGGQICLPGGRALYTNVHLPAKFASGRHTINGATLYISRGIGSTRLPLRYGCLPEITLFTLTPAGNDDVMRDA